MIEKAETRIVFHVQPPPEPVTAEELSNVLVACFEGGSNYWIGGPVYPKDMDYKGQEYASDVPGAGGTLLVFNGEDEDGKMHKLTAEMLKRGIELELMRVGKTWRAWYEDHDAAMADNVLQQAIFGELVYG